jgi:hypothetical protein
MGLTFEQGQVLTFEVAMSMAGSRGRLGEGLPAPPPKGLLPLPSKGMPPPPTEGPAGTAAKGPAIATAHEP